MSLFKSVVARRAPALLAGLSLAAALTSCGGGSGQIEAFAPTRILSFGDEMSLITSAGKKYSINALDSTTGAVSCASNTLWIQELATNFGLVYAECNPTNVAVPTGKIYATAGAKVADVKSQIDGYLAIGGLNSKTLVTIMAGTNDLLDLYAQYPTQSETALKAEAAVRGRALADQVNRLVDAGGRIILPTIPDLGVTPYALAEVVAKADPNRAKLLTALTSAFNTELTLRVTLDGRQLGVIFGDELSQSMAKYPSAYSLTNVTDSACADTVSMPECTTSTLKTDASSSAWMWASTTLMGPTGHAQLGSQAVTRATNNPF